MRSPCTAPSSAGTDVALLTEQDVAVGIEVLKVDGAVPIHVPVALASITVARTTVHALHEDAERIAIKKGILGNHRDDRKRVAIVMLQVRTSDDGTWQHAILEKTKTENGVIGNAEGTCCGTTTVREGRGATIRGVLPFVV